MIEERTEGCPSRTWQETSSGQGRVSTRVPRRRCHRLLGNWRQSIHAIVEQKGLAEQVEVLNEYWKYTVGLRKREAGKTARAAVMVTSTTERLFSGTGHRVDGQNHGDGSEGE